MAQTLAQAELLTQSKLVKGIIRELYLTSPFLKRMQFENIVGNALAINREDTANRPTVGWYQPGQVWVESTGQWIQKTYALKILGGDADVDSFIQSTRSDKTDVMATQIQMKSREMAFEFDRTMIYGDSSTSNSFDGCHKLVDPAMCLHAGSGTTPGALTIARLDELIDLMPFEPNFLVMPKKLRRLLNAYLRTVSQVEVTRDEYGDYVDRYRGIPILVSDHMTLTESISDGAYTGPTGGSACSLFAVRLGPGDGIVGLQQGGITTEKFEKLETKDGKRVRIKWYVGVAQYSSKSLARIDGISTATAVTA